ncbi:hypothetical protein [Roseateles saccharophilus]|uniref:Uncharacterized protein n=1 Tax=Roseateles saccharophilus TaxID=304 RepID=A0A4R3VEB0_ROSSA|nr:hypothetical protein [Roseateles saccharophilus]MDG0832960.1 hypothetical protein [Roseateles saccharophilus]TCV02052.1 hypothetical protein EV671_100587 [Roseateles saccharophilus]
MKALLLPLLPLLLTTARPAFAADAGPAICPQIGEQLTEDLASARQRIGRDGHVRVEFEVDARGRARLVDMDGTRSYRTPVRIALDTLDCRAGTPQRYVLDIRFADPVPLAVAAAASATVARAEPR